MALWTSHCLFHVGFSLFGALSLLSLPFPSFHPPAAGPASQGTAHPTQKRPPFAPDPPLGAGAVEGSRQAGLSSLPAISTRCGTPQHSSATKHSFQSQPWGPALGPGLSLPLEHNPRAVLPSTATFHHLLVSFPGGAAKSHVYTTNSQYSVFSLNLQCPETGDSARLSFQFTLRNK